MITLLFLSKTYIDYKFLLLLSIFIITLVYLQNNQKIKFNLPIFTNENGYTKSKSLQNKKEQLLKHIMNIDTPTEYGICQKSLTTKCNAINNSTKIELINLVNTYNENVTYVFNNKLKNCNYYFDVIIQQQNTILGLANSLIITMPFYENYNFFNAYIQELNFYLNDIYDSIKDNCSTYDINKFEPYNQFNYNSSFPLKN
jgi:hypothetical protein